jgi:type IV pilus assembly protein PilB
MYQSIDKLKALLLKEDYVTAEESDAAEKGTLDSTAYIEHLVSEKILSKMLVGQAISESYNLKFADLASEPVSKEQVGIIPETIARTMRVVAVAQDPKSVTLATDEPEKIDAPKVAALFPDRKVFLKYTLPEYVDQVFDLYVQPLATRFSKILQESKRIAPEIVDEIIKDALGFRASDIHFEPSGEFVTVRFRVDGVLREAGQLPKEYYGNILNRIKVESGMRIDEHFSAQDGAMHRKQADLSVDLRVSLIPTVQGEKVTMRVLGSYVAGFTFADVGLSETHRKIIERNIAKPFGMILNTGPTGSGKTTTLYSLLKMLNKPNVNITTIEDPVEYRMAGTNQIQVNESRNVTFAKGLRAIVRQDPDIILVGEIRDQETAEISVNAALTGHLLLSTFHANDASTAIPRLVEMGIEPFLLSSTLEIIIAQRLVRKICSHCRYSLPITEAATALHAPDLDLSQYFRKDDSVYVGKGCNVCNQSGFEGRSPLFEIIEITPEMQDLIVHTPSGPQIEQLARSQGSKPMFDDGIQKVKSGITTLPELVRVVPPGPREHKLTPVKAA